jgi:hypothetical protein
MGVVTGLLGATFLELTRARLEVGSSARRFRGCSGQLLKVKTGIVESIRSVEVAEDSAVKDRTRAHSRIRDLVTSAPLPASSDKCGTRQRLHRWR